jgi:hypothetical protein
VNIKKYIAVVVISGFAINALAKNFQRCPAYQQLPTYKKTRIQQITTEYKKVVTPIKKQLKATRIALNTQLAQPKINEAVINDLVSKVSSLRNQIFAEHIQAKIQIIKTTGFNPAACQKPKQPKQPTGCVGTACPVPVPPPHIGPKAGLQTAPHRGLHVGPHAGMQTSKPAMPHGTKQPTNDQTENSLWE